MNKLWHQTKTRGEEIGILFIIIGFVLMILSVSGVADETTMLAIGLASISVGLGFTSVGISTNADNRQTDLLKVLDKKVSALPLIFKGDTLTPSGQAAVKELLEEQSKEAVQKRLDDDTRRVGYVRGELFQNEDGSWAIHWGGKYPL